MKPYVNSLSMSANSSVNISSMAANEKELYERIKKTDETIEEETIIWMMISIQNLEKLEKKFVFYVVIKILF